MLHSIGFRVALLALIVSAAMAQTQPIDTARSVITVRVYKSGLFSAYYRKDPLLDSRDQPMYWVRREKLWLNA
jgi:hypothetical protein